MIEVKMRAREFRGAHASGVLVSASRRNELSTRVGPENVNAPGGHAAWKSAKAERLRQHARGVRSPDSATPTSTAGFPISAFPLNLTSVFRLFLAFIIPTFLIAAEPPIPADERAAMLAGFTQQIEKLDASIKTSPDTVALYSKRGDCHLFLAHFAEAVADFEKMIALDPAQDAPHWRLGIAYYFTGEFAKSAKQFLKYHDYDGGDRENGIWKFLGDVKVLGLEPARRAMLVYTRFDREPFPALYAMFAGEKTTDDVFAEIKAKNLTDNTTVMFFANYYAGLNEDLLGHRGKALAALREAVAGGWMSRGSAEPTYMWQVARLHYDKLAARVSAESRVP